MKYGMITISLLIVAAAAYAYAELRPTPDLDVATTTVGEMQSDNLPPSTTEDPTSESKGVDRELIGLGESRVVGGVNITFLAVQEDSRCPVDAQCIRAGTAIVHVKYQIGGEGNEREIEVGEVVRVDNVHISFFDLLPLPQSGVSVDTHEYQLAVHVATE